MASAWTMISPSLAMACRRSQPSLTSTPLGERGYAPGSACWHIATSHVQSVLPSVTALQPAGSPVTPHPSPIEIASMPHDEVLTSSSCEARAVPHWSPRHGNPSYTLWNGALRGVTERSAPGCARQPAALPDTRAIRPQIDPASHRAVRGPAPREHGIPHQRPTHALPSKHRLSPH